MAARKKTKQNKTIAGFNQRNYFNNSGHETINLKSIILELLKKMMYWCSVIGIPFPYVVPSLDFSVWKWHHYCPKQLWLFILCWWDMPLLPEPGFESIRRHAYPFWHSWSHTALLCFSKRSVLSTGQWTGGDAGLSWLENSLTHNPKGFGLRIVIRNGDLDQCVSDLTADVLWFARNTKVQCFGAARTPGYL